MVEKIIENVINQMIPHLNQEQLEHLSNVLYVNFHGKEIREECTELIPSGLEGDEAKVKMFIASKKAVNRQDNTLRQYSREIEICHGKLCPPMGIALHFLGSYITTTLL